MELKYIYNDGETPTPYYYDNCQANNTYKRNFQITKQYYYVNFIPSSGSEYVLDITSRLQTTKSNNTINNNPSTFDYKK